MGRGLLGTASGEGARPVRHQLATALLSLGHPMASDDRRMDFNLSKCSLRTYAWRVIDVLCGLTQRFVSWPTIEDRRALREENRRTDINKKLSSGQCCQHCKLASHNTKNYIFVFPEHAPKSWKVNKTNKKEMRTSRGRL